MRQNIQDHFRVLGLTPGVGPLEIRRAYRLMVRRWHPDHFKPGSPMQATAEDITKELNNAFEHLYRKKLYRKFLPKSDYSPESDTTPGMSAQASTGGTAPPTPTDAAPPKSTRRPVIRAWFARKREQFRSGKLIRKPKHVPWARATAMAGLAVLLVPIWQKTHERRAVEIPVQGEAERRGESIDDAANPNSSDAARSAPAGYDVASSKVDSAPPAASAPQTQTIPEAADMSISFGRSTSDTHIRRAEAALDVFAVGDPKEKVLALQGAPDEATENLLRYGASVVYLKEGLVSGWSDQRPRLHVRKWTTIDSALNTFSIGSTMGDVVRAQGLPTTFTSSSYNYGSSTVFFENDRVVGWDESDVPLRSFDLPFSPFVDLERYGAPVLPSLGDFRITALPETGF